MKQLTADELAYLLALATAEADFDEESRHLDEACSEHADDAREKLRAMQREAEEQAQWRTKYAAQIQEAREDYADPSSDNIEIDDEPMLSPGADSGVWVSAWLWVWVQIEQEPA